MTRAQRDIHLEVLMNAISDLMQQQGVSQAELARRMGADSAAVNKALKLKVDPRASTIVSMLKALNCAIAMKPLNEDQPLVVD